MGTLPDRNSASSPQPADQFETESSSNVHSRQPTEPAIFPALAWKGRPSLGAGSMPEGPKTRGAANVNRLEDSNTNWRALIELVPDFILVLDPTGTIRFVNRTDKQINTDQFIGSNAFDYVHPDHRHTMSQAMQKAFEAGQYTSYELPGVGPDGQIHWYSTRMGPFRQEGEIRGVTMISSDISDRKRFEERLLSEEKLLRQMMALQERDRRFVSYELHDGLLQYVISAKMQLESIMSSPTIEPESLQSTRDALDQAIQEGRRLIGELRPMIIDEQGIVDAINYLIAEQMESHNLSVQFRHKLSGNRYDPILEGSIFRIVQEALTNVKRHSGSDHAEVTLVEMDNRLFIDIRDEGVGFDPSSVPPERFGLRGISERARLFGGNADIISSPGNGTRIAIELSLEPTRTEPSGPG